MSSSEKEIELEKKVARTILASVQKPVIGEAGKTGSWRTLRPSLIKEKCIVAKTGKPVCHICWMCCPEGATRRTFPPEVNYDYCKGCGICAHECPHKALKMIPEKSQGKAECEADITPPEP
jgi:pyruvate ferredoxin oxidoreductase delta subunit